MNKKELIKQYTRQAKNLNHNIKHEIEKPTQLFNPKTDLMMVEYMKGQLSVIREIIHFLKDEKNEYYDQTSLEYQLGETI